MKKILLLVVVFISLQANSQDTTIATLSIKARLVQTLAPFVRANNDTAAINLLHRWDKKWNVPKANWPSGTTQVSVDSISVKIIAACYAKASSYPQGAASVLDDLKADIATIRAANSYLDQLLDAIDAVFSNVVPNDRIVGRILLTGTNQ